jgi:solute carrier family 35 protein F1/2
MAHYQPELVLNKGDDVGPDYPADATHVQPKDATSSSFPGNNGQVDGHGAIEYAGPTLHSEVLEEDAQTKGHWLAYIKTKQFWLVLVLGQGMYHPICN